MATLRCYLYLHIKLRHYCVAKIGMTHLKVKMNFLIDLVITKK